MVIKKNDDTVAHGVYRKEIHTNQYLHPSLYHHPNQKIGVLNMLITRSIRISDEDHSQQEKQHLRKVFRRNDYSYLEIYRAFKK